ncbi:MAG: hypothetical protein M0008_13360 [Actinomycetota bacterium]|nr:hypothetical protein [Actinomycetota bacterium]
MYSLGDAWFVGFDREAQSRELAKQSDPLGVNPPAAQMDGSFDPSIWLGTPDVASLMPPRPTGLAQRAGR